MQVVSRLYNDEPQSIENVINAIETKLINLAEDVEKIGKDVNTMMSRRYALLDDLEQKIAKIDLFRRDVITLSTELKRTKENTQQYVRRKIKEMGYWELPKHTHIGSFMFHEEDTCL